jgi:hypothetical protein
MFRCVVGVVGVVFRRVPLHRVVIRRVPLRPVGAKQLHTCFDATPIHTARVLIDLTSIAEPAAIAEPGAVVEPAAMIVATVIYRMYPPMLALANRAGGARGGSYQRQ